MFEITAEKGLFEDISDVRLTPQAGEYERDRERPTLAKTPESFTVVIETICG